MTDDTVLYDTPPPPKPPPYPVSFDVEGPAEVSRLSTFSRIILAIPLALFVSIVLSILGSFVGGLILAHWISVLIRGRPVGWICRAIVAIQRFSLRALAYFFLIADKYPPFEGDWGVSYEVDQTDRLQRKQLVIWKTLASIPHFIALIVLWFAVVVCVVISWFAILFTGRFPLGLRGFIVGWMRWGARVSAYWVSLRDEYPPFSLSAEASPASNTTHVWSGVGGGVLTGAAVAGVITLALVLRDFEEADVSYASLLVGEPSPTIELRDTSITLLGAADTYAFADGLFVAEEGDRLILFTMAIENVSSYDDEIYDDDFQLKDSDGDDHDPVLVSYGGSVGPGVLLEEAVGFVAVIFEIDIDVAPEAFEFQPEWQQRARFEFIE